MECGVGVGRGCTSGQGYKAVVRPGTEVRVEIALKSRRRCRDGNLCDHGGIDLQSSLSLSCSMSSKSIYDTGQVYGFEISARQVLNSITELGQHKVYR